MSIEHWLPHAPSLKSVPAFAASTSSLFGACQHSRPYSRPFALHTGTHRDGLVAIVSSALLRVEEPAGQSSSQKIECKGGSTLHNEDTALLCCSGATILCYNFETKQQQTFTVPSVVQLVCPADKYDSKSDIAYVVGNKFMGMMDSRLGRCVSTFNYTTPQRFSCVSTTVDGFLVAGTEDGYINFYKRPGQRAMTKLNVKCYVRSIDATADGDFVVVGTESDILLVDATVNQKSAFTSRLTDSITPGRLLSLKEDEFVRSVKFDRPDYGDDEGLIIAVTSTRVVVWTFQQGTAKALTESDKPMVDCTFPFSDAKRFFMVDDQGAKDEFILA